MTSRGNGMLAIAHRSGNTVDGLRAALDAGVDLVEADVHAYRGVLEVRHHKNIGPAHLWDKGELVRRSQFLRVELSELMDALADDPRLMIDLKGVGRAVAPAVARVLREHGPGAPFTVCTQHWWMLDAFDPPVRRVLSAGSRRGLARLRRRLARQPAYGVSVRLDLLTPEVVAELQRSTEVVMTWAVDTPGELARARGLGVDAVISKDLDLLRGVLAERG
ncbi:MAG: glycerophosphodiester phosphodiesterase [Nocardioidaceae bacterium]